MQNHAEIFRQYRATRPATRGKLAAISKPGENRFQMALGIWISSGFLIMIFGGGGFFAGLERGFKWGFWLGALYLFWPLIIGFARMSAAGTQAIADKTKAPAQIEGRGVFGLWMGRASGIFTKLRHGASIEEGHHVTLALEDAAQNILVLGGIGSGKTTRAIQPLLVQLLDQDCGGLIFDVKGDFKQAVAAICADAGREVSFIGPHAQGVNLLAGLPPEMAASFLKSAFILSGNTGADAAFWVDTATELSKNGLGVLSFLEGEYSLNGLYRLIFDDEERERLMDAANVKLHTLEERERRLLRSYMDYRDKIFERFDDKVKAGVNATVAQVLSPFNHPDLIEAFCTDRPDLARLDTVLDGQIFLVDMPLSVWGMGGKVAYTFVKLRLFNVMQRRTSTPDWNQSRPVFFMCDEFQEIVSASNSGLSDLNFWDKSRSSKMIGIISAQSVSSFYAAIGNRDTANALLQNFRQKLCFRTEDEATLSLFNHLAGKVEVARRSFSHSEGQSGTFDAKRSTSDGETLTMVDKEVVSPQLMRRLGQDQAVALLNIGGKAMDDVLELRPVFAGG